jgi:cytoskeleton protein RodZ
MTDAATATPGAAIGTSAGAMLRAARERQGMHIAMLAATMKVSPGKLEALEADRYEELPDLAFARALAKTMCRKLELDPDVVLAKLPGIAKPEGLVHTAVGLNTPFREGGGGGRGQVAPRWTFLRRPVFWATLVILAGAALLAAAPPSWLRNLTGDRSPPAVASGVGHGTVSTPVGKPAAVVTEVLPGSAAAPASAGAPSPAVSPAAPPAAAAVPPVTAAPPVRPDFVGPTRDDASSPLIETVHAAPPTSEPGSPAAVGVLVIRANAEGWVEVKDARGRSLIARTLTAGETVGIDGSAPFKIRLGNAAQTELRYRGQAVNLTSRTAGNTARFELK